MNIGANILKTTLPEPMTKEAIDNLLMWHNKEINRCVKLEEYYKGKQDILTRTKDNPDKANNKIVNPNPFYITTVLTGYFIGNPVVYADKEDGGTFYDDNLSDIFDYNDEQEENLELSTGISIFGHNYELMWNDKQANVRFKTVSPKEMFCIYNPNSLDDEITAAIRHYKVRDVLTSEEYTQIEYYTKTYVQKWKVLSGDNKDMYEVGEQEPHFFKDVPVIEYTNNKYRIGDFERVIALIDAYDILVSDGVNNAEDFVNALLALYGVEGTSSKDITKMKALGVLLMPEDSKAEYVTATLDSKNLDLIEKQLINNIHKYSMTPNLNDDKFSGNQSGVAMQFKLFTTEQVAVTKERKFKKGLQRRIELILNNNGTNDKSYLDIDIIFTRNIPVNNKETVEALMLLKGTISDETIISKLPYNLNAQDEIDKVNAENKNNFGDYEVEQMPATPVE